MYECGCPVRSYRTVRVYESYPVVTTRVVERRYAVPTREIYYY